MARGFSTPEAAAKKWGKEHGIVNVGGSLYWDVAPEANSPLCRRPVNLGVGRMTGRGPLVQGYGATGTNKGWLALSKVLVRRGVLVLADGRWTAKQETPSIPAATYVLDGSSEVVVESLKGHELLRLSPEGARYLARQLNDRADYAEENAQ